MDNYSGPAALESPTFWTPEQAQVQDKYDDEEFDGEFDEADLEA